MSPLVGGIAHHLAAAAVVEVDVDIGHRGAFGVEEPLEQQPVRNRVDVGDAQRVGHQRAGRRAAARADPDVDRPCIVDQVGDDQEVGRKTLVADDFDLVGGPLGIPVRRTGGKPSAQTGVHLVAQPRGLVVPVGHREHRHPVAGCPHVGIRAHPLGDQQRGVARPVDLAVPDRSHLGGGLQVVAVAVELEPVGIRQRLAGLHTQQRLVVVRGVAGDVVAVVGGQRRDVQRAADFQQPLADPAFDVQAVVHQLQEVVLGPEDLPPFCGRFERFAALPEPQPGLHLPGGAAGGGDDAGRVFGDQLGVHPRPLAQLALERRPRRQLEQVPQAGGVLGDHGQVGVGAAAGHVVALLARVAPQDAPGIKTRIGCHIRLDADDRLDARRRGRVVKLTGAKHVAVVGHPDRGHLQPLRLGQHRRNLRGTVQHRVLGVVMQVHEGLVHRDASLWPCTDDSPACRRVCLAAVTRTA